MTSQSTSPAANVELVRAAARAFNAGHTDECLALIAPDFIINLAELPEPMHGREAWRQNFETMDTYESLSSHAEDFGVSRPVGQVLCKHLSDSAGVLVTRQGGLGPRGRHLCLGGRVREVGGRIHVDALAEQVALDGVHELAGRAVLGGQVEHPVGVEGADDRVVDRVGLSLGAGERGHVLFKATAW
jgi:hypothetical protein